MKPKRKINKLPNWLESLIVILAILIFLIIVVYFFSNIYNRDCSKAYATKYCVENNMSFMYMELNRGIFYCEGNLDRLSGTLDKKFYFLTSELEDCKIKNEKSFRKSKWKETKN